MSVRLTGEALAPFWHIVRQYDGYIRNKDVNGIMSLFVTDDEPHSFGLHVNLNHRDALRQRYIEYFDSDQPFESEMEEPVVYQFGEAACLCMMLKVKEVESPRVRITVFLENHSGQWLIRHQHISQSPV